MKKTLLGGYAVIAIAAFGIAAADEPTSCPTGAVGCLEQDMLSRAVAKGTLAALAWPLFFAWEIASI